MLFDGTEVTIEKVRYRDLQDLEKVFTTEFGDEISTGIIKQRVHRIRQFYYLLLPLSKMSNWINRFFNIYVIRAGETVIGFMQVSSLTAKQLHLDYIAIRKKYRGQGLGTKVLQTLFQEVVDKNNNDVILEVKHDNPARSLYERLGFTVQAQVLHYERTFGGPDEPGELPAATGPALQELQLADRPLLYKLYCASIPRKIQQVIRRNPSEFQPSLFLRNFSWFKNYLMQARNQQFVLYQQQQLVALVELRSYPRSAAHILSMTLNRSYEHLREDLLRQALSILENKYQAGKVNTTIYDDSPAKRQTLEQLGFTKQEQFYLMLRPAGGRVKRVKKVGQVRAFKPQGRGTKSHFNKTPF
ncbi:GNAT family N-acetyltransferase|uniref:Acetyltransferase (GNAT) family protein n=1 Tax=Dendrosporobacter quercicolus TaxID=146817 RepID=A0A1G9UAX6_9FIRM|nr:GNAT family N-acetyltransferase [Dendrosporobacter quercicolus]NSL49936.1 GNAT family N-acetyltransferase [Dendrosporobacter quercicolus DSM 1736]SDM57002.1 Acetyltransferase (GNAT) family protein [Dendrosporobacter quercicolus]